MQSGLAATLADDQRKGLDPTKNKVATAFLSLYYGKLAVVEDRCVYATMVRFKKRVLDSQDVRIEPQRLAFAIGFACRRMLSKSWNSGLLKIYDPQRLLESFNDLTDYREAMDSIVECR